jgi:hypothetical protein
MTRERKGATAGESRVYTGRGISIPH